LFVSAVLTVIGPFVLPEITASEVPPKRLLSPLSVSAAGVLTSDLRRPSGV
jgi:hypothetical protein